MKTYCIKKVSGSFDWNKIDSIEEFASPWVENQRSKTNFCAVHNGDEILFRFIAKGGKPLIYTHNNDKLEVRYGERVELFFRNNESMKPYYCLEIDPIGRVLDYKANFYREFIREWHWPDNLSIETTIRADEFSVSGRISLESLSALGLISNRQIQAGVYRGHCTRLDGIDNDIEWTTWVDPSTLTPEFHVPESFGIFIIE